MRHTGSNGHIDDIRSEFISKDEIKKELAEFQEFAFKKNMIEMAIAVMLATAFDKVVKSISESLLMPIVNFTISNTGNDWRTYVIQPVDGIKLEIGSFTGAFIDFSITAIILYIVYAKMIRGIWGKQEKDGNKKDSG